MTYLDVLPFHWDPVAVSDADIFTAIREWRNKQLALSDWTQLSDAPCDKITWAAYRQQLRDLPSQNEDPRLIILPASPLEASVIAP